MTHKHPSLALATVTLDCRDAHELAAFYQRLFPDWHVEAAESEWVLMRPPGEGTGLAFQAERWYRPPVWPERDGEPHKMAHLELRVTDLAAATAHAVSAGAVLAGEQPQDDVRVLFDPAGHPFCLFAG
ncbi:VOC family protein [Streptomyces sp. NPDC048172]|uniref:VOC family protein n=1 Tax=Streptomyces sp. NPDC048172 TaxID=3365505 RepID=UPI00371FB868